MKNFNEIYVQVLKESKDELERLRKSNLSKTIIAILCAIMLLIICFKFGNNIVVIILLWICVLLGILLLQRNSNGYREFYKEKVVKTFIKSYSDDLSYYPENGISSYDYRNSGFESFYDRYHSEDLIKGTVDGHEIMMAEVHTQREEETRDSDGNTSTHYVTIFHGLFGNVKINNNFNGEIKIHSDKGKFGKIFESKKRVEMDSSEFEKYFDVYGDDKIQVMQILTSDIIDEMLEFRKNNKIIFEITINRNQLFIRFYTGSMFEGNVFKSSVDFDTLKGMFDIINFTFDITRRFIKVLEETQI